MSGLKLIYFDGRGRAEVIRVLLAAAGQKFEDKRIDFKDWEKEKPKSKFNSLPNLIYRGKTYGQSLAILTFLAREFGLYGKNNEEGLRCDTVGQFLNEIRTELFTLMFVKEEPKKTELTTAAKESIPKKLKYLEDLAVENGKTGFFVGSKLSYADIMLFDAWNMIKGVIPEAETGNDYPEVKKILRSVQAVPTIKTYLSTRKDSPF